jgi:hypothetical protein
MSDARRQAEQLEVRISELRAAEYPTAAELAELESARETAAALNSDADTLEQLETLELERGSRPAVQVCETFGSIDYIDSADRESGADNSGSGSEWFTERVELSQVLLSADSERSLVEHAIAELERLGLLETGSAPTFYDPDGSHVVNYATGERLEVSARLYGLSSSELAAVCERLEQ